MPLQPDIISHEMAFVHISFLQGIRYAETEEDTCYCEDNLNSSSRVNDVLCDGFGNRGGGESFRYFYDTTLDAGL